MTAPTASAAVLAPLIAAPTAILAVDDQPIDSLLTALDVILDHPDFRTWLSDLDPAEIAARSYWHPNGFAKLVLHIGSDFRIRLHVWPAGPDRRGETNPHGHRWDFASTVLCGDGVRSTTYREAAAGIAYVRHAYVGSAAQEGLDRGCNVRLEARDSCAVKARDRYAVTTETVHTIDPLGTALVATLVVQGRPKLVSTQVYCPPGANADQPGVPLLPHEAADLIGSVLATFDGPGER